MSTKLTLGALVVLLVIVIATSYFVNREGFEDITNSSVSLSKAVNTVSPSASASASVSASPQMPSAPTAVPAVPVAPSADSTTPQRHDVVPEVKLSGAGYDAMDLHQKMDLLRDIQQAVRNEILVGRNTKPIISGETRKAPSDTDATAQGQEYENNCYKDTEYRCPKNPDGSCPPVPDMSEYIRKDAIPCWGCSLDY